MGIRESHQLLRRIKEAGTWAEAETSPLKEDPLLSMSYG